MAHHRCTRCKEESNPRHKYYGGVYCNSCIREIKGYRRGLGGFFSDLFSDAWSWIKDFATGFWNRASKDRETPARNAVLSSHEMERRNRALPPVNVHFVH